MSSRLSLEDSFLTMMQKMSDGNPGGLTVMLRTLKEGAAIDPQAADPILTILHLDDLEIYGSRIWMLYKDVCDQNIVRTLGLLRAHQLGILEREKLQHAIDNRGAGLDIPALMAQVRKELPQFCQTDEVDTGRSQQA